MRLADIPEDAWEVAPYERVKDLVPRFNAEYGELLRGYAAEHEGKNALVLVWMGPTFYATYAEREGGLRQFDDRWPEIAEWHSRLVAKLVSGRKPMFECEQCSRESDVTFAACPDDIEGCLMAHTDEQSFLCCHCNHDNLAYCAKLMRDGPHTMELGIGVGNIRKIAETALKET